MTPYRRFSTLQIGSLIEALHRREAEQGKTKFQYPSNRVVDRSVAPTRPGNQRNLFQYPSNRVVDRSCQAFYDTHIPSEFQYPSNRVVDRSMVMQPLSASSSGFSTLQIGSLIEGEENVKVFGAMFVFQYPSNRVVDRRPQSLLDLQTLRERFSTLQIGSLIEVGPHDKRPA